MNFEKSTKQRNLSTRVCVIVNPTSPGSEVQDGLMINTEHVDAIEGNQVLMGEVKLSLSRTYRDQAMEAIIGR